MFRRPWDIQVADFLPVTVKLDMLLLILWHIWKARNSLVFERHISSSTDIVRKVLQDLDAWSCRYRKLRSEIQAWRVWLTSCIS